jgi:hypothetical protein
MPRNRFQVPVVKHEPTQIRGWRERYIHLSGTSSLSRAGRDGAALSLVVLVGMPPVT